MTETELKVILKAKDKVVIIACAMKSCAKGWQENMIKVTLAVTQMGNMKSVPDAVLRKI